MFSLQNVIHLPCINEEQEIDSGVNQKAKDDKN
jgi:hypothetical protein